MHPEERVGSLRPSPERVSTHEPFASSMLSRALRAVVICGWIGWAEPRANLGSETLICWYHESYNET